MSDSVKGVIVVFVHDIAVEQAAPIIEAIQMLKGVLAVEASVSNPTDWMNRERVRMEIYGKLMKVIREDGEK